MDGMLLWSIVEALLRVPTRAYRGLDYNTGESQIGCPELAPLTVGNDTGLQHRTEVAIELVAVRYTLNATCIGAFVVASANLVSTLVGTGIARRGSEASGNAGLVHSHSFPAHVGSLHLQTKGQMWKAESSRVALAENDQSRLHPARLVGIGHWAH